MRSCAQLLAYGGVVLVPSGGSGIGWTERSFGNLNGSGLGHKFGRFGSENEFKRKSWGFGREGELGHKSWDLVERVNSGTNLGDLAERVNSDTNPGDLVERVNSGTNPGDLAVRINSGVNPRDLAERRSVWGFRLDWSAHPIGNASPYLSEEEIILVGKLKEILFSSCAIKEITELWLVDAGLSPASRGTVILLYFNLPSCLLTCRSGCRSDGSRRATRDAQGDQWQGLSDSPHCLGGQCFSRKKSLEGFIEEASQMEGAEEFDEGLEQLVDSEGVREGTSPPLTSAGVLYTPLGSPDGLSRQGDGLGKLLDL
ncbi:hypothetical protein B296_00003490 [Ensete ventricosum]|uniref:Uncharacterized protein n=1 Tax=Ensete ventricosum TaxID=4639 RepID=A0A427B9E1_ENSVE|nr:hypothetical protein B296_00003490 [Ensete ventricosum]